jgi:hypothetical protein
LLSIDSLLYGIEVKRNVYIDLLFLSKLRKTVYNKKAESSVTAIY